jgi:hypothetical protein
MTVTGDSRRIQWNPQNALECCVKLGMFCQLHKFYSLKSKLEYVNCAVTL